MNNFDWLLSSISQTAARYITSIKVQCTARVAGPTLGAATGLGKWFVGVAVLLVCGDFQRRRQHSEPTAHRALPVHEWPALGMP